jgi:hypothetical protein
MDLTCTDNSIGTVPISTENSIGTVPIDYSNRLADIKVYEFEMLASWQCKIHFFSLFPLSPHMHHRVDPYTCKENCKPRNAATGKAPQLQTNTTC